MVSFPGSLLRGGDDLRNAMPGAGFQGPIGIHRGLLLPRNGFALGLLSPLLGHVQASVSTHDLFVERFPNVGDSSLQCRGHVFELNLVQATKCFLCIPRFTVVLSQAE
jgi:hypothetical protein